jgi:hypothetical protein
MTRAESRRVFGELVAALEQLSDDGLAVRGQFPRAPEQILVEGVTTEVTEHYREHVDAICAWSDRKADQSAPRWTYPVGIPQAVAWPQRGQACLI